jgi:hypothetical protein
MDASDRSKAGQPGSCWFIDNQLNWIYNARLAIQRLMIKRQAIKGDAKEEYQLLKK